MPNKEPTELMPIDPDSLQTVTGGGALRGGSNIDSLINQLNSITGTLKDINKKTSGFSQTEMLMLCMLAIQNRQQQPVLVVGAPRRWW